MGERTLRDLAHDACLLASMIEGLDVLHDQAWGDDDCPTARRARNALTPLIAVTISKAWELTKLIEELERAGRAGSFGGIAPKQE